MGAAFVHLSDIHFGQEKGGSVFVHQDVRERLVEDVVAEVAKLPDRNAAGLIITGDIAFSGKEHEYKLAGGWLDRVAKAAGCGITDVQIVPGNHDVDRDEITHVTEIMLRDIALHGQVALDKILDSEVDCALLYRRFNAFQPFAEGYRCPLDTHGGFAEERVVKLATGRSIRFVRLNSALICAKKDEQGKLILGERQRVLPKRAGEEIIVLSHHPLHWFQDSEDAPRYIRSRARVFISGHEHDPSVKIETIEEGCDLLMLAAGAAVPPSSDDHYTYTYNILEFDWDPLSDALSVHVTPRTWDDERKCFSADDVPLEGRSPSFTLACPNFRDGPLPADISEDVVATPEQSSETIIISTQAGTDVNEQAPIHKNYPLLVLRFFRDISAEQRVQLLVELGALPIGWTDMLSQPRERLALDALIKDGRGEEVKAKLDEMLNEQEGGGN